MLDFIAVIIVIHLIFDYCHQFVLSVLHTPLEYQLAIIVLEHVVLENLVLLGLINDQLRVCQTWPVKFQ